MRRAAIDIGTISVRLLVADVELPQIEEVLRDGRVVHLGEGLAETGSISPEATSRALEAVHDFVEASFELGVRRMSAVATSAVRDADNSAALMKLLSDMDVDPEIISGEREAELAFLGATAKRPGDDVLVVDVGGGSTELAFGSTSVSDFVDSRLQISASVDVGARRVTDRFFTGDPPTAAELEAASEWIDAELAPVVARLPERPQGIIGLSGTITSLSAIHLGLEPYDPDVVDGSMLSLDEVRAVRLRLQAMTPEERRRVDGLEPSRASVIVAGALVIERLLVNVGVDHLTVSEADILWGILIDAAGRGGVAERHTQET